MKRKRWIIGGVILLLLVATLVVPRFLQPDRGHLAVDGNPYFWVGVNYPWKSYQDFGTGAWGHSGVSSVGSYPEVDADFAAMSNAGVRIVKWRLFSDGRYSPDFGVNGRVTGLDDQFFPDLDAAMEIARRHGVRIVFTLFASGFWTSDQVQDGVHIGGHAGVLEDAEKRREIQEKVIVPLLEHIAATDPARVVAYEIIAEPEWGVVEIHGDEDGRIKVPLTTARAFVQETAASIHQYSGALATVESNRPSNMQYWRGLGLDYYSFSWYDWMEPWEPLKSLDPFIHLDKPVVLGEFPLAGSKYYATGEAIDRAYRQGLAGAFAWSYWGGDGCGPWSVAQPLMSAWMGDHWPEVSLSPKDQVPPSPGQAPEPPYVLSEPRLAVAGNTVTVEVDARSRESGRYMVKLFLSRPADEQPQFAADGGLLYPDASSPLQVRFDSLLEDQSYKLSMGLFDASSNKLLKWVDSAVIFSIRANVAQLVPSIATATDHVCLGKPSGEVGEEPTPTPTME